MKRSPTLVLLLLIAALLPATAFAQSGGMTMSSTHQHGDESSKATMTSLKGLHDITAMNLSKTAEMLDEELYNYKPTEDVRTAGQILAHVANAQYFFCSAAAGEQSPSTENLEETATSKEEIVASLKQSFDYCAGIYDGLDDAAGAEMRSMMGRQMSASGILAFNSAHNYEHYGNLVTYMRMNGIVPPSSQQ